MRVTRQENEFYTKKKTTKRQLFKKYPLSGANKMAQVSNDWLWLEYRICMLILQIILEFWEATGQLLFLTWYMVNKNKQNKMKNASQSSNLAHKSLQQLQFKVGWEPGDKVHFQ